jgi:glycerophosphoryl diester phosphodiesterase
VLKDSYKKEKNSVPSILAALRAYDGCEFDVRLTRDRVLVLYHDAKYNGRRLLDTDFTKTLREYRLSKNLSAILR